MKHLALLLALLAPSCAPAPGAVCNMVRVTDLPITIAHGHLLIDATLNGRPARLLFDTGSETSIISRAAAKRLHLDTLVSRSAEVIGIGGRRFAATVEADHFTLGTLHGEDFLFLASDGFGDAPDAPDGALSTDFLSKYDIDLDLPEGKLILYRPLEGCDHQPVAALDPPLYPARLIVPLGAERTDTSPRDTAIAEPEVIASIDGRQLRATIDTGTSRSVIFREVAARHGLDIDALAPAGGPSVQGIGPRAVRVAEHRIARIDIGDISIQNLPVEIIDQHAIDETGMLLGLDFMSRVHVWISNSSGTLMMQFPPRPSPPAPVGATPDPRPGG